MFVKAQCGPEIVVSKSVGQFINVFNVSSAVNNCDFG